MHQLPRQSPRASNSSSAQSPPSMHRLPRQSPRASNTPAPSRRRRCISCLASLALAPLLQRSTAAFDAPASNCPRRVASGAPSLADTLLVILALLALPYGLQWFTRPRGQRVEDQFDLSLLDFPSNVVHVLRTFCFLSLLRSMASFPMVVGVFTASSLSSRDAPSRVL